MVAVGEPYRGDHAPRHSRAALLGAPPLAGGSNNYV